MVGGVIYKPGLTRDQFEDIAVNMIAIHILDIANEARQASLLLSGGSTPGPVYEKLSNENLPWDKVEIGLVDERWVEADDAGSNAALIRRTLLQNRAEHAAFTPMKTEHNTAQLGQRAVEVDYKPLLTENSLAVLGMGTDGHVCSWFPDSQGLESAVDPEIINMVQAITAKKSNVTGNYLERMTLTLSALMRCKSVLLLITGEEKRQLFESRTPDLPISHLINADNIDLTVLHAV